MVAGSSPAGRTLRRHQALAKRKGLCIFAVRFNGSGAERAFSSAGSERSPHTREVTGSSPVLPTTQKKPRTEKCGVFVGSLFKPAQRRRRKKPRTGVQGFKVGNRKESESVGDTNLNVRQHCPSKVVANVFNFELNFFFMLFHLLSMSGVFNTGTTSG